MAEEDFGILEHDKQCTPTTILSTLPSLLLRSIDRYRKPDAFRFKGNGRWLDLSTDDFVLRVKELFFGLKALGLRPADRVAIISENRVEWAVADYAAQSAGASTVPIYTTLSAHQIGFLLKDSEPSVVFVSTASLLGKLQAAQGSSSIRYVVAFDSGIYQPGVMRLDRLYDMGRPFTYDCPGDFQRSILSVDPASVATIICTSGTTGVPKGAMLTHRNLISNILATSEVLPLTSSDVSLSFLPLSHILQRHVDYASLYAGTTIVYAESVTSVAEDMMEVRPTFCAGVPRFFEKVYVRIRSEAGRATLVRRAIFEKAVQIGKDALRKGRSSLAYRAADRAVFQKIRERLGGRIRFFISGGAALEKEIAEFFHAVGLPIFEGYGLTEGGVVSLNPLDGYAPNGAGKIFDGLLEHQADGSLRPMLATELPVVSADGKSWTITLRDDVKFSDGNTFGALRDFEATPGKTGRYYSLATLELAVPSLTRYVKLSTPK